MAPPPASTAIPLSTEAPPAEELAKSTVKLRAAETFMVFAANFTESACPTVKGAEGTWIVAKPVVGPKLIVWQLGDPVKPVSVMLLQLPAGETNDQPDGRSTLNMFAGAPVTEVAEIVIAEAFVPELPI